MLPTIKSILLTFINFKLQTVFIKSNRKIKHCTVFINRLFHIWFSILLIYYEAASVAEVVERLE